MFRYSLADRLHKTLDEIDDLSIDEQLGWSAYCKIVSEKAS
jgi:hypothetical protein